MKALREVDRTTQEYVKEKTALPYQGAGVKVQLAQAELQPQPLGQLVLDDEVGLTLVADALLNLHEQIFTELLTDGDLRSAAEFAIMSAASMRAASMTLR